MLLFTVLSDHFENVASNVVSSHVRNSYRGMLHADSEDRPLQRPPQGVRPLGPLRGSHETEDMCTHPTNITASMQYKYVQTYKAI